MIVRYYALRDAKVSFMNLQPFANDEAAMRNFRNALTDSTPNIVNRNPEDYSLYYIGDFDDVKGTFEPPISSPGGEPLFLCNHLSFVKETNR